MGSFPIGCNEKQNMWGIMLIVYYLLFFNYKYKSSFLYELRGWQEGKSTSDALDLLFMATPLLVLVAAWKHVSIKTFLY